jgi:hypothetical protein
VHGNEFVGDLLIGFEDEASEPEIEEQREVVFGDEELRGGEVYLLDLVDCAAEVEEEDGRGLVVCDLEGLLRDLFLRGGG